MLECQCRICLEHFKCSSVLIDLFAEPNAHLVRQIYSLTGLQIIKVKGHPRHMCSTCSVDLESAIEFRERCFVSQKQFIDKANAESVSESNNVKIEDDSSIWDIIEEVHDDSSEIIDEDQKYEDDIDSQIEYFFTTTEVDKPDEDAQTLNDSPAIVFDPEFYLNDNDIVSESLPKTENNLPTLNKRVKSAGKNSGPFVCDECGKSINSIGNFREHKLRHAGIKSFICKYCRKPFTTCKELIRHLRKHTGERPYACKYCPNKFSDLGTARQHERRHINSRPFECKECGKCFFSSSCLSKHRLIHKSMPRTHHCSICDVWFHRLDHLTAHKSCRSHELKKMKEQTAKLADVLS